MKKTSWFVIVMSIFLTLVAAACASTTASPEKPATNNIVKTDKGQYKDISVDELKSMLAKKDFTFVNVHIPFQGNIAGTDLSIPYDQIENHLDQLPPDKNAKIVLYCRSDRMSNIAARKLADLGYTNLYNLVGGFDAWKTSGLPLETQQK